MTVKKPILVNCPKNEYEKHRNELRAQGLKEWKDFKWYKFAERKVCLISANCHGPELEKYLLTQKSFTDIYAIHPFMAFGGYMKDGVHSPLDDELLSGVDLLLFQHMRPDNSLSPTYADENILKKVTRNCKCISIPNFWPMGGCIHQTQTMKILKDAYRYDAFYQDELLDLAYEKSWKKDLRTVIAFLNEQELKAEEAQVKADLCLERLLHADERWDIKIADYVVQNYKTIPMFNDIGHPSSWLMWKTGERVMKALGLVYDDMQQQDYMDSYRLGRGGLVHACIKRALGLQFQEETFGNMEIDYVREYMTGERCFFLGRFKPYQFIQAYYLERFGTLLPYNKRMCMGISSDDVVAGYRLFLGREPESNSVIERKLKLHGDLNGLRKSFMLSSEFTEKYENMRKSFGK